METKDYIYSDYSPTYNNNKLSGYSLVYDITAIKQALINLFVIEKLEVPGKPAFGNPLSIKVFELFDTFSQSLIETSIRTLIETYEPRVQVDKVSVTSMEELNRLIIEIEYFVIIDNRVIGDTVYLPFAHNTRSFLDGRGINYTPQFK
ncbi:MAG: GPW/gp25 family protein [Clostridiales bacterium]|nr:GPW/gp25 family protein [Clostridiales bacterium]